VEVRISSSSPLGAGLPAAPCYTTPLRDVDDAETLEKSVLAAVGAERGVSGPGPCCRGSGSAREEKPRDRERKVAPRQMLLRDDHDSLDLLIWNGVLLTYFRQSNADHR